MPLFQFHKGTIRTRACVTLTYFNSIKVRLEQAGALSLVVLFLFQFHKGTIRTETKDYRNYGSIISIP